SAAFAHGGGTVSRERLVPLFALAASLLIGLMRASGVLSADARDKKWALFTPEQIEWRDGPPSMPHGARMALLEGDPTKEGFFTMRLRLPDGYRVAPHWHPNTERLTI